MLDAATGEGIYQYRLSLGLSRRAFGEMLGLKVGTIYQMECRKQSLERHKIAVQAIMDGRKPPLVGAAALRNAAISAVNDLYKLAINRERTLDRKRKSNTNPK